jgi:phosphatidylglycerol---prolipoprotein diacylglyceryl transferase
MLPILLRTEVAGITVSIGAYGLFLVLAAAVGVLLAVRGAHRLGVERETALVGFALAVGAGFIGARAATIVLNADLYAAHPAAIASLEPRGFTLYGGLAAGALAALLMARRWGIPAARLADAAVPAVAGGIVLVRIGCLLAGCCAGTGTDLPWGIRFPQGSMSWGIQVLRGQIDPASTDAGPVHPTQLYEAGAALAWALVATAVGRRSGRPGVSALVFVAGLAASRAVIQLAREPLPTETLPPWVLPVVYALIACVTFTILLATARRPHRADVAAATA